MLVENHQINLTTLNLVDNLILGVTHTEVELCESRNIVTLGELWEHLLNSQTLVHPRHDTIRVVCSTGIGHNAVQTLQTTTLRHHLTKVAANLLILVATHLLWVVDTTRVERRVKALWRALRELIIITQWVDRVALDKLKLKVQVIVETIRSNGSLLDWETLLVHLEGGGHMLGILHAGIRHITDEYNTLQRHLLEVLLIELLELGTNLVG